MHSASSVPVAALLTEAGAEPLYRRTRALAPSAVLRTLEREVRSVVLIDIAIVLFRYGVFEADIEGGKREGVAAGNDLAGC